MLAHVLLSIALLLPLPLAAQGGSQVTAELGKLAWQMGPTTGRIGDKATIPVPPGFVFLDDRNTSRFLEINGNPPRPGHYLLAAKDAGWFAVFSFDPSGYVKDDDKIDAEQLLKILKGSDEVGNDERRRLGMQPIYTDGWQVTPHYDAESRRLEWGTRLRTERGEILVNYTSRLLGRTGVMSAVLVSSPATLAKDTEQFKSALQQFAFVPGEKYAEFKAGDKVAEYGLTALIVGGAAAAAAKSGLLKSLGKLAWVGILALLGGAWALLRRFLQRPSAQH